MRRYSTTVRELVELRRQVNVLQRALRWYADPRHWGEDDWGCVSVIQPPDYANGGQKARNALKRAGLTTEHVSTQPKGKTR